MGKPYDLWFQWGDSKQYCSEFAWKTYQRALGIEIGQPERWKDFDLSGPASRRLMSQRRHKPDPDELIVTPVLNGLVHEYALIA